jgi:glycosyltransferase involved in cell wall biosynthesis
VPKKGFDTLVEASSLLADRGVEVEATLAGEDGEHSEEIRRLIAARGVGRRFELAGPLDQTELHRAYLGADVFCLPCRILADGDRDGIPNVLVEAMACGLPVVTTPVSGIPELVRAEANGLLVPPDDPEAVAEALLRLRTDPELAARLGRAGRESVLRRFDGDHLARRLAALFEEAIA